MEIVKLFNVQGQLRNVIWALECCHGYNPHDTVFWGIASGQPMGDKAWKVVGSMVGQKTYEVQQDLIDFAKSQDSNK